MYAGMALALLLAAAGDPAVDDGAKPKADAIQPDPAWTSLGRSLWFDQKEQRLILRARVVLRDGFLEHLMCSKGTKEHEAILATDAVPAPDSRRPSPYRRAEPGHPVQFVPKFRTPGRPGDRDRGKLAPGR